MMFYNQINTKRHIDTYPIGKLAKLGHFLIILMDFYPDFFHSILFPSMYQSRLNTEPKFCRYLCEMDLKYPSKIYQGLRQLLNSEIVKVSLVNPFVTKQMGRLQRKQIEAILLFLGRQMDQLIIRNFNFSYLDHFLGLYKEDLLEILSTKDIYCDVFCLAIARYLQEIIKSNELINLIPKIKQSELIDLLLQVFQKLRLNKQKQSRQNQNCKQQKQSNLGIYHALIGYSSAKYLKQFNEEEMKDPHYLERAMRIAYILIEEVELQIAHEVVRQFVQFTSHLLIFNQQELIPIRFFEFTLEIHQGLARRELVTTQEIDPQYQKKYYFSIGHYIKIDPAYLDALLRMIKFLLSLHIKSDMLVTHFQVLILIMGEKIRPGLKEKLYDILIENQDKKLQQFIDKIYGELLSSDPDVTQSKTQCFTLQLAEAGDRKRKIHFVEVYFYNYTKNNKKLSTDTINFIVETYLEEQLNLIDFETFVCKEAQHLKTSAIKKLHEVIALRKEKDHINLLSIILEKRLEKVLSKNKEYAQAHPFLHRDWLQAAGNCQQIYLMYLKMIVDVIGKKSLQVKPNLINFNSSLVRIQIGYFPLCLEYYDIILEKINKNQVFNLLLFRYMIICQAIFGYKTGVQSHKYFASFFAQITDEQVGELIVLLEYLVRNLKNKSSVLLYLQAILQFQRSQVNFYKYHLDDIGFMVQLLEQSTYFQISTYSFQAFTLLYELAIVINNKQFQENSKRIMRRWISQMNNAQCNNLCYLFCFRQVKKVFPYLKEKEEKITKQGRERIWRISYMILEMLDVQSLSREYMETMNNKIIIELKTTESQKQPKKAAKLQMNILRNDKMDFAFVLSVHTLTHLFSFEVKNQRCYIYSKENHENATKNILKQLTIKQLKKIPETVAFAVKFQSISKQKFNVVLSILGYPIDLTEDGSISSIDFQCDSRAYVHDLVVTNLATGESLKKISEHLTSLKNLQVRVKFLPRVKLVPFLAKFDFERMYCIWGEMLKYFRQCSPIEGFKMFIRLSYRLFKQLELKGPYHNAPHEIIVMKNIFTALKNGFKSLRSSEQIDVIIQLKDPKAYSFYMYHLFVSAFLPMQFWVYFSPKTRTYLIETLQQCLTKQDFKEVENQNCQMFQLLCELACKEEPVLHIISEIILKHQSNSLLTTKFQHWIVVAQESEAIKQHLTNFLEDLIGYITSMNEQNFNKRVLCKFLIIETKILDIVFSFCSVKSKISLIHYIMYNSINASYLSHDQSNKIRELVDIMKEEELSDLVSLLNIELKMDAAINIKRKRLSHASRISRYEQKHQTALHTELYLLIKVWNKIGGQILEDAIVILTEYLNSTTREGIDPKDPLRIKTQNTICCEQYVQFLYFLIEIPKEQNQKWKAQFKILFELSFKFAAKCPKKKFLKFMSRYLEMASNSLQMALYPLLTQNFNLVETISNYTVILQYIFELLMLMRHRYIFKEEERAQVIEAVYNYILCFIINIEATNQLQKPLVYVYPKMYCFREPSSIEKSKPRIKNVEGKEACQLKGGVYFKLVIITIQLLHTCCDKVNFTKLIETLFFKSNKRKSIMKKSVTETTPTPPPNSNKIALENELAAVQEQHLQYFKLNEEKQLKQTSDNTPGFDLTASIQQFFLMRLCNFLQNFSSFLPEEVLSSYSNIVVSQLQHPKIQSQIYPSNINSIYNILEYEDVEQARGVNISSTPPHINQTEPSFSINFSPSKKNNNQSNFLAVPSHLTMSPSHDSSRSPAKTRKGSMDTTKKLEMLDLVSSDPRQWATYCASISFSKQFSNKAKQLRFNQLLHVHYVLNKPKKTSQFASIDHEFRLRQFTSKHRKDIKMFSSKIDTGLLQCSLRKVKKIYPYTSSGRTVIRVMENCLGNMACPITQHVTCKDYSLKKIKHMDSIGLQRYQQQLLSEDSYEIAHEASSVRSHLSEVEVYEDEFVESPEDMAHEKVCELVTREGVYFCNWQLSQRQLVLVPKDTRPSYEVNKILIYGTPEDNLIKKNLVEQHILLDEIDQIFARKFSQMYNSIQIFMNNGTSKFITFYTKQLLSHFLKKLNHFYYGIKIIRDPVKEFQQRKFADKWAEGAISNFDYLMLLNKYSGRTHNDVNQYYIFPWILRDYQSQKIDLTDPMVYRDLSKPIGALNSEKLKRFMDIYKGNMKSHLYGSHYSTSLFILYYLVRLQPFTTLHRDMQKGFDLADRLFSSIYQVWDTLMSQSSTSDIKELIPQFFYLPAFLKNVGNIEFGEKMSGEEVNDVVLPPWASSAEEFIITLRAALQSDWVSQNLHLWIDLIFGKHQCSEEKYNVFLPITYEQKVKWKELMQQPQMLKATIDQITYFGQCPTRLFNRQHRPKIYLEEVRSVVRKRAESMSHTTSSHIAIQQVQIPQDWKLTNIFVDHTNKFHLELENISASGEKAKTIFEPYGSFNELKQLLEDSRNYSKKKGQSRIRDQEEKIKFHKSELKIGTEIVMSLEMNFTFQQVKVNDIWIVCFGSQGLRTYNWQQELFWKWEKQQVCNVYLEPTKIIFSTPSGKVVFYSFFDSKLHEIQAIKQSSSMEIAVSVPPRLPSKLTKNQRQYRILCVGDGKKVTLVTHIFEQSLNTTSLSNMAYGKR